MELFWDSVKRELENRRAIKGAFILKDFSVGLSSSIKSLIEDIRTSTIGLFKEDEEVEFKASITKLGTFADGLDTFSEGMDGFVRWAEIEEKRVALRMSPMIPLVVFRQAPLPGFFESLNTLSVSALTQRLQGCLSSPYPCGF
ncbi:MAG: hypothetical protein Q8M34_03535 [Thermodesulfovibrionales bacterium]|nr:hypothetical protein [Thermodesulfovibrionales bacterium]